jgi:LysR family transcriptional activator of nhaA
LLTEAGQRAARQRLAVGLADGLPKLLVHRLLQPVLGASGLHLQCFEGPPEDLLAQLALHRLDVVLSDRAPARSPNLKLYTHRLCESPLLWFAPPRLAAAARRDFPASLQRQPVLLPSTHAAMRGLLERWFEQQGLQPQVVGEFQDSALLKTFGAAGLGLFPAMALVQEELQTRYGVKPVGACEGVVETIYAIGTEKRVQHPLVARLLATGPKSAP